MDDSSLSVIQIREDSVYVNGMGMFDVYAVSEGQTAVSIIKTLCEGNREVLLSQHIKEVSSRAGVIEALRVSDFCVLEEIHGDDMIYYLYVTPKGLKSFE